MMDIAKLVRTEEPSMLSGVIIAGGKNRRMGGSHKALLLFQNERLIHRQIRQLKQICDEIILVTNEPKTFLPLIDSDVRIITDYYCDKGPLAGIHAGLSLAQYPDVWLVGCDMPFLSARAAQFMLDLKRQSDNDAVIPYIDGRLHPLHGIYDKRSVNLIPSLLNKGQYRVGGFLDIIPHLSVEKSTFLDNQIDTNFVINVNTPEEYEQSLFLDKDSEG
ncbi:molybdenum cofactor guanylyltransferase [Cohnella sp. WQ 127256]|uniref:molybdenum cofactor guanylyltransferase n=1 Tax=Cohnella sp. WQ 127256 TaxID=2938790 RepID=UPI002117BE8C|nr:molybdenum cofactor guanylyltransferase [Cohnella sp. WQ 127256]